jgi:hypothetical protein
MRFGAKYPPSGIIPERRDDDAIQYPDSPFRGHGRHFSLQL